MQGAKSQRSSRSSTDARRRSGRPGLHYEIVWITPSRMDGMANANRHGANRRSGRYRAAIRTPFCVDVTGASLVSDQWPSASIPTPTAPEPPVAEIAPTTAAAASANRFRGSSVAASRSWSTFAAAPVDCSRRLRCSGPFVREYRGCPLRRSAQKRLQRRRARSGSVEGHITRSIDDRSARKRRNQISYAFGKSAVVARRVVIGTQRHLVVVLVDLDSNVTARTRREHVDHAVIERPRHRGVDTDRFVGASSSRHHDKDGDHAPNGAQHRPSAGPVMPADAGGKQPIPTTSGSALAQFLYRAPTDELLRRRRSLFADG